MDKRFYIGEMADLFNVPASTLRYWEDAGVLTPHKNADNHYREYTADDLMALSDLIFYKSLGLPLKQIRSLEQSSPDAHAALFQQKINDLTFQQQQIQSQIQKLHTRLTAIQTLNTLKQHPFTPTAIDTDCIVAFDLVEIEKLRQYIEDPYLYSRVQHSETLETEHRGLTIPKAQRSLFPESDILWEKNDHPYLACLMKESVSEGFSNNLPELLASVRQKHRTGFVISRFLLSAQEDGKLYDFYKTFIEILPAD